MPDPRSAATLYASSATRLFKTSNGGASWFPLLAGPATNQVINVLAIDPGVPSTLYATTYEAGYADWLLWKTADGGQTWVTTHPFSGAILTIAVDPSDSAVVFAGILDGRIFQSADAGSSWTEVFHILEDNAFGSLAIDPGSPGTIYAGWVFGGQAIPEAPRQGGVFRSVDGGATWGDLRNGNGVNDILIGPSDSSTITLAMTGSQLIRSADAGATFTSANTGLVAAGSLAASPAQPDTIFNASGGFGVFRATFACPEEDTLNCRHVSRTTRERQPVTVPRRDSE